ncbi:hypothetical protein [Siminovitchia sp. 179-K 8D1 HS]|uniref:hypothetical protein n=1 Tax=Siminovitchia sp. 179-K 8D1 HS TaxID=3142385 RepID=UPI0039A13E1E
MSLLKISKSLGRKISPVELVKQSLAKIKKDNPVFNAFITVCKDQALADAVCIEG